MFPCDAPLRQRAQRLSAGMKCNIARPFGDDNGCSIILLKRPAPPRGSRPELSREAGAGRAVDGTHPWECQAQAPWD